MCRAIIIQPYLGVVPYHFTKQLTPLPPPRPMKNEWDFFIDVQRKIAAGQQLVKGFFLDRFVMPFDEQRGLVVDEEGNEYELGDDYKQALTSCIREKEIPWTLRFQERLICFGPGISVFDKEATITIGPESEPSIE